MLGRVLATVILLVAASAAFAQQPEPRDQLLAQDWMAMTTALRHVQDGLQAMMNEKAALQKKFDDTNAYWKAWCGERPGCATPSK